MNLDPPKVLSNPNALIRLESEAHHRFSCYELQGATQVAEHLLWLDPSRSYPHYLLGEVARRRRDWSQAFDHFRLAHESGRDDVWTFYRLGEVEFHLGDRESAERWLHLALERAENDHSARKTVADFLEFLTA